MNEFLNFRDPFVCLVRHGETELSAARRYNGISDIPLTQHGETQAIKTAGRLSSTKWEMVLCSPLMRARRTATLSGFTNPEIVDGLIEFDYGDYEAKTTEEIRGEYPEWNIWTDGCPNGETPDDVARRIEPIIDRLRVISGPRLIFSHSHAIRIFTARWLGLSASSGAMFEYSTAHLSVVGIHRDRPVLLLWNDGSHLYLE